MPIFIAKTRNGYVEDAVLADNSALAQAYWQGKGILADSITERSEQDLQGHPTGVISIVSTERKDIPDYGPDRREYLLVSKS